MIREIDMEPLLKEAQASGHPAAAMEFVRETMIKRIRSGEHIHLYGLGVQECIYPNEQCWKGTIPRVKN